MIRASQNLRKRKFISRIFLIIFIFLIVGLGYLIFNLNFFTISAVEIKASNISCVSNVDIQNYTQINNKNIILLNKDFIEKRLKEKYFCIKSVEVIRNFPNKVILEISGRVAVVNLNFVSVEDSSILFNDMVEKISSSSAQGTPSAELLPLKKWQSFTADEEGVVFGQGIKSGILTIYFIDKSLVLGEKIANNLIKSVLNIFEKAKSSGLGINKILIFGQKNIIVDSTPKIVFSFNNQLERQLAALQLIISKAKIDDENIEFVDLRFDKPIVRFAPKKKS